mmetsp:Transcript_29973/g.46749  ORF Transcript_29973/g.46749 Transcript_29973/m.46749 type:complete len:102 (-) Transcript_29973:54-359(-)
MGIAASCGACRQICESEDCQPSVVKTISLDPVNIGDEVFMRNMNTKLTVLDIGEKSVLAKFYKDGSEKWVDLKDITYLGTQRRGSDWSPRSSGVSQRSTAR